MKPQIVIIHGGDTFLTQADWENYLATAELNIARITNPEPGWKDNMVVKFKDQADVIYPVMPNKQNARYSEWNIWFEKIIPFLEDEVVLVGHSMGGIFLTKYLSENNFPKKIASLHLVSAPFKEEGMEEPLGSFRLGEDLSKVGEQVENIFLYHSEDDPVVPFDQMNDYKNIFPNATVRTFSDRGHFNQTEFPELVENIKSLL